MQIRLNGMPQDVDENCTIAALVTTLNLDMRKVAVEVNLAIVPRSLYGDTTLNAGDTVEIVRFIGGG